MAPASRARDHAGMVAPLPRGYLSPHFSLAELTASSMAARRGLPNTPGPEAFANLHRVALLLEDVRRLLGDKPVLVSSGYRSPPVNQLVKGSRNSAHMHGLAADFIVPAYGSPLQVCQAIEGSGLWFFDQLILEGTWVHISLSPGPVPPRREVLTAVFKPGRKTTYLKGLPA